MNDSQNYEKLIQKKTEGKILLSKTLLIILYSVIAIVCVLLIIFLGDANPLLFVLAAVLEWLLITFSWKLTQVEYEYAIFEGVFVLSKILGKLNRKDIFENDLSEATMVAPYSDQYKKDVEAKGIDRVIKSISSENAENIWFILFERENGEKTVVLFEADEKCLKLIRRRCPRAVARVKLKECENTTLTDESEE